MERKTWLITLNIVLLFILLGIFTWGEDQKEWRSYALEPVNLTLPNGETERCLTCHRGIEEISSAHPIETIGCVSCHGGNGLALDKDRAHQGLRGKRNPADLEVVKESCGAEGCHSNQGNLYRSPVDTVSLSPMATKTGEITETLFTFGKVKDHLSSYGVNGVKDISGSTGDLLKQQGVASSELLKFPTGTLLKEKIHQNCLAFCHLNTGYDEENNNANVLGGCAACHTPFTPEGTYQGDDPTINKTETGHAPYHRLTTEIPYTVCNSCHNQGIHSFSQMKFIYREDVSRSDNYYIPQAQYASCEVELDCIDCHTRNEVMGDGHLYGNKGAAQSVRCQDCHGTTEEEPKFQSIDHQYHDAIWGAQYLGKDFPKLSVGDAVAVTDRNEAMINVRKDSGQVILYSKISGKKYLVPQVKGTLCQQNPQEQKGENCHSCHDISEN